MDEVITEINLLDAKLICHQNVQFMAWNPVTGDEKINSAQNETNLTKILQPKHDSLSSKRILQE